MKRQFNARALTQTALFTALLCVISPVAIPAGSMPVTLSLFALLLTAYVLPWRRAIAAAALYLLMGAIGLPVFSGGQGGVAVLLGPTGGYLWSYVPMTMLAAAGRSHGSRWGLLAGVAGLLLCELCGAIQYALVVGVDFATAVIACVLPFVLLDLLKLFVAWLLGEKIRGRLLAAGLLD